MEKAPDLTLPEELFTSSLGAGARLGGVERLWPSHTLALVVTPPYRWNKTVENPLLLLAQEKA